MPPSRESLLEAGFVLLGLGFVAGFSLLVGGRVVDKARHTRVHRETPPNRGSVPSERHQHLAPSPR